MKAPIALVILFLTTLAISEAHIVSPDGTGDFPTIQAALDALPEGSIIELTDATFQGDGNRDLDFRGDGAPTINGCTFFGNQAPYGAGMACWDHNPTPPKIIDCVFTRNTAEWAGAVTRLWLPQNAACIFPALRSS